MQYWLSSKRIKTSKQSPSQKTKTLLYICEISRRNTIIQKAETDMNMGMRTFWNEVFKN